MDSKLIARYIVLQILRLAGMAMALFWPAGRVDWWPAWAALVVMLAWMVGEAVIIFGFNPGLLADRLGSAKGGKTWDSVIVGALGQISLVRYILAGLDQRFGWTGGLPLAVQLLALALCFLGYALFVWATASNAFFSSLVRIQAERGHAVASGGPYRFVRHPAYIGAILFELAVPLLLASWVCLLVSGLNVILIIVRTALEDRTLQAELAGYGEYARRVRYRLLPGVW